jgi:hypothetical protein
VNARALLVACLLAAACAGPATDPTAPPSPDDVDAWNARFAGERWVRAWGESRQSSRQAALDARGQIAEQVSSSITAESRSLARATMRDSEVEDFQDLRSDVRTTATFERAELIRVVENTAHEKDGVYRVMAVLDRQEVARAIQLEYDRVAATWRPSAALSGPLPDWTAGWYRCRDGFPEVLAAAAESHAVSGLYPAGFSNDRDRWEALLAARDSVLRDTEIVLELGAVGEIDASELAERLSAAFASLGVTASPGTCSAGDVALRLQPVLESRQVIGRVLSLELDGTIGPCHGPIWSELSLSGPDMRGAGRDPASDLMQNLTTETLASLLTESVGHILPVQPAGDPGINPSRVGSSGPG